MTLFWRFLLLFFTPCLSRPGQGPVTYFGNQVLRISKDPEGIVQNIIQNNGLDVWASNKNQLEVRVPSDLVEPLKETLKTNQILFETVINDIQEVIDNENPKDLRRFMTTNGMSWTRYHKLSIIYRYMDSLASDNPEFVSVGEIGRSVENRPIKYIKISSGIPNAKAVFIEGGIHAREWVSPASVTYIIRELVENRNGLPKEILALDFYIAPVVNPDGYEYTHTKDRMWRKNRSKETRCSGVDMNRNFDFHWGGEGAVSDSCEETYAGKSPASEPEVKALQNFLTAIRSNLKGYISFHSFGEELMLPYGYERKVYAEGFEEMKKVADEAAKNIVRQGGPQYTVGNIADVVGPSAGSSVDWVKGKLHTPMTFAAELRDSGGFGFILPAKYIIPTAKDALEIVKAASVAAARS